MADEARNDEVLLAKLTVFGASEMTEDGRMSIVEWLHEQADKLIGFGKDYEPEFTAEARCLRKSK